MGRKDRSKSFCRPTLPTIFSVSTIFVLARVRLLQFLREAPPLLLLAPHDGQGQDQGLHLDLLATVASLMIQPFPRPCIIFIAGRGSRRLPTGSDPSPTTVLRQRDGTATKSAT